MTTTCEITLGGQTYRVPPLNLGQIERMYEVSFDPDLVSLAKPFTIVAIGLEKTDGPKSLEALRSVQCSLAEVMAAVNTVMILAGLRDADPVPPTPAAVPTAADVNALTDALPVVDQSQAQAA